MGAAASSQTSSATNLVERILSESPVGMSAGARLLGTFRGGKPTVPSTLTRWAMHGVTLPDGTVLKLEVIRLNGRLLTSKQALIRFIAAQQQMTTDPTNGSVRSPAARRTAAERAGAELEAIGC